MLEAAVDGLGWAVGAPGLVEISEHVGRAFVQCPPECGQFAQGGRDAARQRRDQLLHDAASLPTLGVAVSADHALVNGPSDFDFDMGVIGEQLVQAGFLAGSEQVGASVKRAPYAIKWVTPPAPVAVELLLATLSAAVQGLAGEAHDMKGAHHCRGVG